MGLLSFLSSFFSSAQQTSVEADEDELFFSKDACILIIDDSRTHVAVLKKWLSGEGYDIISAYDGREGIIKARQAQPDLILMDIVMPKINGFQATRYLKRQADTRHIPIIMVSGEEQNSGKLWARKLGACSFLVKPLKKEQLFRIVHKVLEHYAMYRVN